jgi:hypothetical protein
LREVKGRSQALDLACAFGIDNFLVGVDQGEFAIVLECPTGPDSRGCHIDAIKGFDREERDAVKGGGHRCQAPDKTSEVGACPTIAGVTLEYLRLVCFGWLVDCPHS